MHEVRYLYIFREQTSGWKLWNWKDKQYLILWNDIEDIKISVDEQSVTEFSKVLDFDSDSGMLYAKVEQTLSANLKVALNYDAKKFFRESCDVEEEISADQTLSEWTRDKLCNSPLNK